MDKVTKYKILVSSIIDQFEFADNPSQEVKSILVKDIDRGQFLVFSDGWRDKKRRIYGCSVHIEVTKEGKIWMRQDTTDPPIVQMLLDNGVPKEDIVLAYYAPIVREDTGFAMG